MSMNRKERARTPYVDYLKPIIANGDTGFGGITATIKLCKLFVVVMQNSISLLV